MIFLPIPRPRTTEGRVAWLMTIWTLLGLLGSWDFAVLTHHHTPAWLLLPLFACNVLFFALAALTALWLWAYRRACQPRRSTAAAG